MTTFAVVMTEKEKLFKTIRYLLIIGFVLLVLSPLLLVFSSYLLSGH